MQSSNQMQSSNSVPSGNQMQPVDIEELRQVSQQYAKEAINFANKKLQLQRDFKDETVLMRLQFQAAKQQLCAQNQLILVPCVVCEMPDMEWTEEIAKQMIELYGDIRNHGFHCSNHVVEFHYLVGDFRIWSCCEEIENFTGFWPSHRPRTPSPEFQPKTRSDV